MRIATWNIRSGGGKRLVGIADRILEEDADLTVLTEYRAKPGQRLQHLLGPGTHAWVTSPPPNANGVLAISRTPIESAACPVAAPIHAHRWLRCRLPDQDLEVLAVHIPNMGELWGKAEYWDRVLEFAESCLDRRAVIVGDFNTGLPADTQGMAFHLGDRMQRLVESGWVDAWRAIHGDHTEFSWYSPNGGNGFRVDFCFLSPMLSKCVAHARFDHLVRTQGLSDHSLFSVELR